MTLDQVDHQDFQAHQTSLALVVKVLLDLQDLQVPLAPQVKFAGMAPIGYFWHNQADIQDAEGPVRQWIVMIKTISLKGVWLPFV